MRASLKWAVALSFLIAVGAVAQEPGVPEGTTVKLLLLRQKSVQKELDLGADAAKKIMDFTNAQADAVKKALDMGEAAAKAEYPKLAKQNEKFLTDTLNDKQGKRLDQITMQMTALTHLLKPEVTKDFKLNDDQVKKLRDHQTESQKGLIDLLKSKEGGKTEKLAKLREDTKTKILAILTEEQKAKARELTGPAFTGEIVFEDP